MADDATLKYRISSSGKVGSVQVKVGDNLLMAGVQHGLPLDFYCSTGKCATCIVRIEEGSHLEPMSETEAYRLGARAHLGYRLACQSTIRGDVSIVIDD